MEDMASLAVQSRSVLGEGASAQPTVPQGSAHFAEMEDSAIMLELSAGNMVGFGPSDPENTASPIIRTDVPHGA